MKKTIGLLVFLVFACTALIAQQDTTAKDTLFEKAAQGQVRFYFDDHYFLVDKDCSFKSIERLSQFVIAKNAFHGEFRDFDRNGKVILTGTYNQGIKEGAFKAYHPNGTLKWETNFVNNQPSGAWKYYYPDGKPMLIVNFDTTGAKLVSFWDRSERQRVIDGNGTYQFKMPFESYNEYGYPFFERKGKIKNGVPSGYWTTYFVDEKNHKELFTEEVYNRSGMLTEGYNVPLDEEYNVPLDIIPSQSFLRAEQMLYKQCNFDEYSGFNTYLAEKLSKAFRPSPTHANLEEDFSYRVSLSKDGDPETVTLTKKLNATDINKYLEMIIKDIPFYFPSMDEDGQPITDVLTISGKMSTNKGGAFTFHSIQIAREKQP